MYDLTLFKSEMANAKSRGKLYWAKAVGMGKMRFSETLDKAIQRAEASARGLMKRAKINGPLPDIQSGKL